MKIIQYKKGVPIKKWNTIAEIQKKKGYLKSHISECLNNKRNSAYGYEWKYQIRRKGKLKYWFKNKNEMIKDVGFLCDQCEKYENIIEKATNYIKEKGFYGFNSQYQDILNILRGTNDK